MSGPNAFSVASTTSAVPGGPQRRRVGVERRHPAGDDHVAEIGDVVAVQVSEQQRRQSVGSDTDGGRPLLNDAPAVDEKRLPACTHER